MSAVVYGLLWSGLAMARSLGRAGVEVTGIARDPHEFGLRSKYLTQRVRAASDEDVLAAIPAGSVLFPERDAHVSFVLEHWDAVREVANGAVGERFDVKAPPVALLELPETLGGDGAAHAATGPGRAASSRR